ncbi:MAG: peptidase M16 [Dehalococcoidia bacterium]|nr:peptidase M16 [Dehalococcoidia bacterium]
MSTAAKASPPRLVVDRWLLPNGIPVLVHENPTHPLVNLRCLVYAGSAEDTAEQAGLASFTGSSLLRGTEHHTFEQINEVTDSAGMSLHTHAGRHLATIGTRCLSEDVSLALDLISEVLRRPTFPDEEVAKLRDQILTNIRQEQHNTRSVAGRLFREAAYPVGHPYRLSPNGEEESVGALTRDDLAACHRERYGPKRTFIVVSGDVRSAELRDLLTARLGSWEPEVAPAPEIGDAADPEPVTSEREVPGKTQSDLIFGTLALSRSDPEWETLRQATVVFGQLGLSGRLGATVRDEQGLAYGVGANLDAAITRTAWTVRAGVNPANVDRALASIRSELDKLRAEGVTEEELVGAQRYLVGGMALQLETNAGITSLMQQIEHFGLGLDYVERRPALVQAVTREAILDTVRRYLPEGDAITAVAGPAR